MQTLAKVARPACPVADGDDTHPLASQFIGHVERKAWQIHTPIATGSLSPEQRMRKNRSRHTFDFLTEAHA